MSAIPIATDAPAPPAEWEKRFPEPTTKLTHGPLRWTFNKVIQLVETFPIGHVVLLAWVAVYFVLFQSVLFNWAVHLGGSHQTMKEYWDTLFSQHIRLLAQHNWDNWRHFFRNGGEAYLVTLSLLFLTFNPYTHKHKRIHTAGQVVGRFFFATLCVIPLMVGFGMLFHGAQHWLHTGTLAPSVGAHPNLVAKLYSDQWTTKVSVVLAAIVARRPMFPVYAFVQEYFAERRAAKGKRDHWWHPAPFRARVRELRAEGQLIAQRRQSKRGSAVVWLMSGGGVLVLGLAVYGGYILNHYK